MELFIDDDGFVRAPAPLVYRRLTHVGAWDEWWPGMRVTPVPSTGDDDPADRESWDLRLRDGWHRLRIRAEVGGWRHEAGFTMRLSGDLDGTAEFWLEPSHGGTVVHHVVVARTERRGLMVLRTYRRVLRRGLWAFKDRVQSEVRTGLGLPA